MVAPPEWYKIPAGYSRRGYDAPGSPLGVLPIPPSKARRATFWNFARRDYLAARKSAALALVNGGYIFNSR